MKTRTLVFLLLSATCIPGGADVAGSGHVLAPKFREVCQRNLDVLIETKLDEAEARGSSCLAEVVYDKRRASALKDPIVQTCTLKMVAHARGDAPGGDDDTSLKQLFNEAYGVIFRANCLDREVRNFPSLKQDRPVTSASY